MSVPGNLPAGLLGVSPGGPEGSTPIDPGPDLLPFPPVGPNLYPGLIHGSVTLDTAAASEPGPFLGIYDGAVTAFDLQINNMHFSYAGVGTTSLFVNNDPADGSSDSISAQAVLPPGAFSTPPNSGYVTELTLVNPFPDRSGLSSSAIPDDLRAFANWQAEVDIIDPDAHLDTSIFGSVVITARTVPEPAAPALLTAAGLVFFAAAQTGRMPRFFAGSGSSGRRR